MFVGLFGVFRPIREFFTHCKRDHCQCRNANFDLYSKLMAIAFQMKKAPENVYIVYFSYTYVLEKIYSQSRFKPTHEISKPKYVMSCLIQLQWNSRPKAGT